ncbi:hypothetical protein EDC01DRAFT_763866 [Geopyxis carbonaria]|nr:hypothetical protein EDC01DRAFT_763866 [Geopyxis carbonaria]
MASTAPEKPFTVCVFCGANPGSKPLYTDAAAALARVLHANSWGLTYGGGTVGLMGTIASTLVSLSGPESVTGIIPRALIKFEQAGEIPPHSTYGTTTVVADMHARKAQMAQRSQAFVALPGGFGTMEELFEVVTWSQLGIHGCPVVLFNVGGFYDGLLMWMDTAVREGFVRGDLRGIVVEAKTAEEVAERIREYVPPSGRMDLNWASEGPDEKV